MSGSNKVDFIESYLSWIKKNSSQVQIGDYAEITTPFMDSHNDHIQFYISRTPEGYRLTDDGYTLSDLEMCGCDVKSKKRKEMISHLAESLGVTIQDSCITVDATNSDIARKQHVMIQAILKISDMFLTTSSRVKGLFFEEVDNFFAEKDIRNTPSVMLMGQSGLSHRFDFVIPASRKSPERVITVLNTPTKQTVQAAIFAWNDTAKTRSSNSKGYIVLNDRKKSIGTELLSAIRNYGVIPIQWADKEQYVEELVS